MLDISIVEASIPSEIDKLSINLALPPPFSKSLTVVFNLIEQSNLIKDLDYSLTK